MTTHQEPTMNPPPPSDSGLTPEEDKAVAELLEKLWNSPRSFGFFQAVMLLTRSQPGRVEPGSSHSAREESVTLRGWPSLVRSGTDIRSLNESNDDDVGPPAEMEVSFMGLYGLASPTPTYFWDYVQCNPDSPLRDFLDIFTHRWIGLFYQAWKRYRWPLVHKGGSADPMTRRALCLLGLGTERKPIDAEILADSFEKPTTILVDHEGLAPFPNRLRLLAYAPLLAPRTRSAWSAQALLADYFQAELGASAKVEVEENVFQWAYLNTSDQNKLGRANCLMATTGNFIIGARVPDRMGAFRVHLGPLTFESFAKLLPYQKTFQTLLALGRLASPFGVEFDVDLKLEANEVPSWSLGSSTSGPHGRLGWTTWAQSQPRSTPGIVRLRPPAE